MLQALFTKLSNFFIYVFKVCVILLFGEIVWFNFYWSPNSFFTYNFWIFFFEHWYWLLSLISKLPCIWWHREQWVRVTWIFVVCPYSRLFAITCRRLPNKPSIRTSCFSYSTASLHEPLLSIRSSLYDWFLFICSLNCLCLWYPLFNDSLCYNYLLLFLQNWLHIYKLLLRWCWILHYETLIKTTIPPPLGRDHPMLVIITDKHAFTSIRWCFKWLTIFSLHLDCPIIVPSAFTAVVAGGV